MKTRLCNDADEFAMLQVCGLETVRSPAMLLARLSEHCPPKEDMEIIVKKDRLADSFRGNPSLFASRVLEKSSSFVACAGFHLPDTTLYLSVILFRRPKERKRFSPKLTLKQTIKGWMHRNDEDEPYVEIPVEEIPPFLFTHPEQLAYQIKRETNNPIKITRLKKVWRISHKLATLQ